MRFFRTTTTLLVPKLSLEIPPGTLLAVESWTEKTETCFFKDGAWQAGSQDQTIHIAHRSDGSSFPLFSKKELRSLGEEISRDEGEAEMASWAVQPVLGPI